MSVSDSPTSMEAATNAAVGAVQAASKVCRSAQGRLRAGDTLAKSDASPVTIADFAAQAVVCATLIENMGTVAIVGEEHEGDLTSETNLLAGVTTLVQQHWRAEATSDEVYEWISLGGADGSDDRYWTLDPIDGTKGFLRGEQYAIALGLIEDGQVRIGVLGCPNLPNPDGSTGAVFVATGDRCDAYYGSSLVAVPISVAAPTTLAEARFCESVESGHSNQDDSARIAERLGITAEPYRIDSQCKYAAVARGDASIYLRLPTSETYREKIWDHAAGMFVVEQAGGRVTDVTGAALDFTQGTRLEHNRGIVATDGRFHDEVIAAVSSVLGDR